MAADEDLPPVAQGLGWILAIPFFIWSTWTGIVIFTGGTVPLLGLEVKEGSLVWAVVWFAVLEWFAFLVVVGIPVMLLAGLTSALGRGRQR